MGLKTTDMNALTAAGAGATAYQSPGVLVAAPTAKMTVGFGYLVATDGTSHAQAFCFDGSVITVPAT